MSRWSFFSVCKYSSPFKTSLNKADAEESGNVNQTVRPQNDWYRSLVQTSSLHQVQRGAAAQILHDDPELGSLKIRPEVLGDVGRVTLAEHHDLLLDVFDLILGLFQVNNFDSNNLYWSLFYQFCYLRRYISSWTCWVLLSIPLKTSPKDPFPIRSCFVKTTSGSTF